MINLDPNLKYDRIIRSTLHRILETETFREILSEELHKEFRMPTSDDRQSLHSLIRLRLGV